MKNKIISQKGFSFSFDALLAMFLFVGVLAFLSLPGESFDTQKLIQKQTTIDLIEASVKLDKLQDFNQIEIEEFFTNNLPTQYDYRINIDSYTSNGSFSLDSEYSFGNTTEDLNEIDYALAKKIFLNFNSGQIENFNSAKLLVWVK
jgi:hypothetical protein